MRVAGVVLAAGAGSRFGGAKLLSPLHGRPLVARVVEAAREAGLDPIVVVTPPTGEFDHLDLGAIRRVLNPHPEAGLSSSVRVGLRALEFDAGIDAAVILPGDQPRVRADVIRALVEAAGESPQTAFIVPRYADDRTPNPVLARRPMWRLADELAGDRGFGPILATHPELVRMVDVEGRNPDVDTRADLAAIHEAAWAERVRANRDQVDRFREVPDGPDFYAPVTALFRADPDRTDDPVLDILRTLTRPGESWLDIGAGAGRYALPLARVVDEVFAVEPSSGMIEALRAGAAEHAIDTIRTIPARWPMGEADGPPPTADVSLIAHVGYDIEAVGPFLGAMEGATRRLCVAVLMERQPSSIADIFWPPVHGEARVSLPALPEFVELIQARGADATVTIALRTPRRFGAREELEGFLRRQLWIAPGSEKDRRFRAALDDFVDEQEDGFGLVGQEPLPIGVVTWAP